MSLMMINVCGQFEVAELLARDLTSKEIESALGIGKEELKARILDVPAGYSREELGREEQAAVMTMRLGIIVKVLGI